MNEEELRDAFYKEVKRGNELHKLQVEALLFMAEHQGETNKALMVRAMHKYAARLADI